MALTPGTRLGVYEVLAQIGEGGMGQVYRGTDTTLGRQVAIKILPDAFAADAERVARFEREAKTLASLNHPNIAAIYGFEKSGGTHALVMELVEGDDLSQRIARGAIPIDEALSIARQIAEALEAAHEQGIIHRDLKPANIKVRPDNTVKVLDFGLAKAMEPPGTMSPSVSQAPTITTPAMMTGVGMILGTAAYMSPEQARGKPVDKRADIWAFGAVLYEMLTGTRAFGGEDVAETLANVINKEPAWDALPTALPPYIRQTLRLCLKKPLRERVPDVGTVRLMLDGAFDAEVVGGARDGLAVPVVQHRGRGLAAAMAAALATALVVGASAWWFWPTPAPPPPLRFAFDLPPFSALNQLIRSRVALSLDGQVLAYATTEGLYVRALGELIPRLIPGSEGQVLEPAFSPDGRNIVYLGRLSQGWQIRRIAVSGGSSTVVASGLRILPSGLSWGWDDMILLGAPGGVFTVPAGGGGEPRQIVTTMSRATAPQRLPGTTAVLYTAVGDDGSGAVVIQEPGSAEGVTVLKDAFGARYVATGHLVYAAGDQVLAVPFDVERRAVTGTRVPVGQGVLYSGTTTRPELPNIAAADTGAVAIVTGGRPTRTLVWVDRAGREEALRVPPRDYVYAQLSPDGRRIALDSRDQGGDIWIFDLMREALSRLTFDNGRNRGIAWSPDGRRVAFSRALDDGNEDVWWQNADGSGMPEPLTAGKLGSDGRGLMPSAFTPDGKRLLFESGDNPRDIGIVNVGNPASAHYILSAQPNEYAADVSPDGQYFAYNSNESGVLEVYVRPLQDPDAARWQISNGGGTRPRWSPTGKELFYLASDTGQAPTAVMAVPVTLGGTFTVGRPTMVIRGDYAVPQNARYVYDVTRDGQRFLMFKEGTTAAQLLYIQN